MIAAGRDQIQGWKEIAAFLGRDERTAKRWEKQRGLPVRRIPGGGRANVYMLASELELWLATADAPVILASAGPGELSTPRNDRQAQTGFETPDQFAGIPAGTAPATQLSGQIEHPDPYQLQDADLDQPPASSAGHPLPASLIVLVLAFGLIAAGYVCHRIASNHALQASSPYRTAPALVPIPHQPAPGVDQLNLQGVFFYEQRTPASLERARHLFEQAIALDPQFAPAYAGLANTFLLLREYAAMPQPEAYTRARAAAERAVQLDPTLPDPHTALGFIHFFFDWNPTAAHGEFLTALRLNPNSALAHHWYGSMLTHQGLYKEAIEQLDIAQRLQPTSSAILTIRAYAIGLSGHRDEAIDMLQTVVNAHRDAAPPHHVLANLSLLVEPRDLSRYLDEQRFFSELRNDQESLAVLAAAGTAFHRFGEAAFWAATLAKEKELHPQPQHPTFLMAQAEAVLGQNNQALNDLDLLFRQHDLCLIGLAMDPSFASLRSNPRFQHVLTQVGLPQPAITH